jgi:hypothetical protein
MADGPCSLATYQKSLWRVRALVAIIVQCSGVSTLAAT